MGCLISKFSGVYNEVVKVRDLGKFKFFIIYLIYEDVEFVFEDCMDEFFNYFSNV